MQATGLRRPLTLRAGGFKRDWPHGFGEEEAAPVVVSGLLSLLLPGCVLLLLLPLSFCVLAPSAEAGHGGQW